LVPGQVQVQRLEHDATTLTLMSQHVPINNQYVPVNNQHVQSIVAKVCHTSGYMVLLLLFLSTACVGVDLHQQQLPANY